MNSTTGLLGVHCSEAGKREVEPINGLRLNRLRSSLANEPVYR